MNKPNSVPSYDDMTDATLYGLRNSAVAHGWDDLVETVQKEIDKRGVSERPSAVAKREKMRRR